MIKHTPGKWFVETKNYPELKVMSDIAGRTLIADLSEFNKHFNEYEAECNALLIASAPEMLEALVRFRDEWVINGNPSQRANNYTIEKQIYAAIAKATGEKEVQP